MSPKSFPRFILYSQAASVTLKSKGSNLEKISAECKDTVRWARHALKAPLRYTTSSIFRTSSFRIARAQAHTAYRTISSITYKRAKLRLASSSIDEADCPKNTKTTSSANACTYTPSSPSSQSKESRMRFQKVGPAIEPCIQPLEVSLLTALQRSAQSPPGLTDFQRKNIVLKAEVLEERHTGDYISEVFQSMLKEWGIQKQNVHCMVRDGGSNMKRACSLSEIHNVDCTAHQLHLVVKEAIKNVDTISVLLGKCRKIAGHFNHSTMAKQELEKYRFDSIKSFKSFARLTDTLEFQLSHTHGTKNKFFSDILIKKKKEKLCADLETEENLTATTSTGVKPTIRKEHSQSLDLEVSIANMLDSDDDDEQSENQMSDTKANLLTEYMSEKDYQEIKTS
ncbi:hypothetical protein EVAR_62535_1 [Eumeta japonica]|uniref:Zinc finger BED domain-containing protein 4 n=1 Tax=Eumeta variegata TaxID=151549 RepID=A0A4C1ZAZ7_EUMVA|nr:hypothetical protein EVAR_62535_1 [Eumeta japonica]